MDCVLGIDLGTSNAKVALFGIDGRPIAVQTASYPIVRKSGDFAEQDPRAWWQAIQDAANSLMAERADSLEVRVIGLSGQMHGLVLVDHHHVPLRDAIIWPDRRTAEICCDWEAAGHAKAFRATTGGPLATGFMAPSLEWIRRHEPDTLKRARYALLPKDYIRCILTGSAASEPTDAAGTFLFDIGERAWSVRILETLGIRPDLLPPIIATESVAGNLLAEAATGLGVPPGIPVAAGSSDLAAALAAVGVDEPGTVAIAMSTGGTVATTITKPIVDSRLHTLCYTADNTWTLMVRIDLIDRHVGLIVIYVFMSLAFGIWLIRGFFEEVPVEIEESAYVDGCTRFASFLRITLPMARAGIVTTAVLIFIITWNEFFFASILTRNTAATYTVHLTTYFGSRRIEWGRLSAASTVVGTVPLIFAVLTRTYLIRGFSLGAVRQTK